MVYWWRSSDALVGGFFFKVMEVFYGVGAIFVGIVDWGAGIGMCAERDVGLYAGIWITRCIVRGLLSFFSLVGVMILVTVTGIFVRSFEWGIERGIVRSVKFFVQMVVARFGVVAFRTCMKEICIAGVVVFCRVIIGYVVDVVGEVVVEGIHQSRWGGVLEWELLLSEKHLTS